MTNPTLSVVIPYLSCKSQKWENIEILYYKSRRTKTDSIKQLNVGSTT